jgi:hypothetical protein
MGAGTGSRQFIGGVAFSLHSAVHHPPMINQWLGRFIRECTLFEPSNDSAA